MAFKDYLPSIITGANTVASWLGIGEGRQDRRQRDQNQALIDQQATANKNQADYEQKLRLDYFDKTGFTGRLADATRAGVSKAAAIGNPGGGSGGASVAPVSTSTAADAASTQNAGTASKLAATQILANVALLGAQKKNVEADTADKLANLPNKGEMTGNIAADTASKEQGIMESQKRIEELDAKINNINTQTGISQETKSSQIKIAQEEAVSGVLRNMIMAEQKDNIRSGTEKNRSDIKVNNEKIKQMSQSILQGWEGLKQGDERIAIDKFKEEVKANYPGISDVMGRNIDDLINSIWQAAGRTRPQYKSVQ